MLHSANSNMHSARIHPQVIDQYIAAPIPPRGRVADLHINRMGVIPIGHTPRRWRLITDLSFPEGGSVNDGIDPGLCSLCYTSVDTVAAEPQ